MTIRQHTFPAFTLIELMAVIALLAVVASVGIVGLASASDTAKLDAATALALDADRFARLLAQRHGGARLGLADGGTGIVIVSPDAERPPRRFELPVGVGISFIDPARAASVESVRFNARGRGPDYLIRTRVSGRSEAWRVSGLTGWAAPEQGGAP